MEVHALQTGCGPSCRRRAGRLASLPRAADASGVGPRARPLSGAAGGAWWRGQPTERAGLSCYREPGMVIYGIHPVLEGLRAGTIERIAVLARVSDSRAPRAGGAPGRPQRAARTASSRLDDITSLASASGVPLAAVSGDELNRLSAFGVHQGVVAWTREARAWTPTSIVSAASGVPLVVVLDGIEDPHNLGAILRTACAAGVDGVVRQTRHAAPLSGVVAKASAGALAHVRIADVVNVARAVEELKGLGLWTVALDAEATRFHDDVDLTLPTALVIGAEGTGVRRLVRERCDWVVRIPMAGHVASLNASVAAGVALFEAVRQRRRTQAETRR